MIQIGNQKLASGQGHGPPGCQHIGKSAFGSKCRHHKKPRKVFQTQAGKVIINSDKAKKRATHSCVLRGHK